MSSFRKLLPVLCACMGVVSSSAQDSGRAASLRSQIVVVQFEPGAGPVDGAQKTGLEAFDRAAVRFQVHTLARVAPFLDRVASTPAIEQGLNALRHTFYVRYGSDEDPYRVAAWLARAPGVVYAEPLFIHRIGGLRVIPNDPLFGVQTYLQHMRLPQAWDIAKSQDGSPRVVLAIIDSGTDWRHEDLEENVWVNTGEVPDNGIDDDQNGFVDDVHGANFANENPLDNDPSGLPDLPESGLHGTATATTAGAVTDNEIGIAGSSWNAAIMPVNVGCKTEAWGICYGYEGVLYAAANGADVINTSWGDEGLSAFEREVLELATNAGSLVVTAAGNFQTNLMDGTYNPAGFPRALTVGATEKDSRVIAPFSNYGLPVDVYAPGVSINVGIPGNGYEVADGTSFSSPLVAGVATLVKTRFPSMTPDQLREQIRLSSTRIDVANPLHSGGVGGGYVNAEAALTSETFPAVRIKRWSWADSDGDGTIRSGETEDLRIVFVNHLAGATNLHIGLEELNTQYLAVSPANHDVGTLASGDSVEVVFRVTVASDAPPNQLVYIVSRIREGAFTDSPDFVFLNVNNDPQVVKGALQTFYNATDGIYWTRNDNWDSPVTSMEDFTHWFGITMKRGQVAELDLHSNNLGGTLPGSSLAKLGYLENLDLWANNISGPIPVELAQLSRLKKLRLSSNNFTGPIPVALGQLSNLIQLRLSGNDLSGTVPTELGTLSRLEIFDLSNNSLTGPIPSDIGQLSNVLYLDLSGNSISGQLPAELGQIGNLSVLSVRDNNLTGQLPHSLTHLPYLEALYFEGQELCAPPDSTFTAWLSTLREWSGSMCTGMWFSESIEDQIFTAQVQMTLLPLPTAAGGQPPYAYAVSPALPAGLAFDATDRTISGRATAAAAATTYTYTAIDATGKAKSMLFTIEVVSPVAFATSMADLSFTQAETITPVTLPTATGGAPPVAYTLTPALPAGLIFHADTRMLYGTPTAVTAPTAYLYEATGLNGSSAALSFNIEVTAVLSSERKAWPDALTVHGNYPNPFRGSTYIAFDLPRPAAVSLTITDLLGRSVWSMPARKFSAGKNLTIRANLSGLASGLYLYRVLSRSEEGEEVRSGRLVMMH